MFTRILSVFNLLKRVGFALLLLGVYEHCFSEWGNQVVLWSNQQGVSSGGSTSDIEIDGSGRAHIAFFAEFRYSQDSVFLHRGVYYCCVDTLGNLVVPATLLTDSAYWDVSVPKILLFEPDSIWVMAKSSDADDVFAYRYISLSWDGVTISPPRIFETCTRVYATGWDLISASDRTVVLLLPDRQDSASIKVIAQEPDGTRTVDCELAWDGSHCDRPLGFMDHADSLQLFWRQAPSWNAIYTKRIGIRDHISADVVDQFIALSPDQPGYIRSASRAIEVGDTMILIRESHADNEFGDFVRTLRRDSYETISTVMVAANGIQAHGMNLSSDSTLGILTTPIYPVFLVQNRNLSDLSVASESDSLRLDILGDIPTASGYATSRIGHHHVIISTYSSAGTEGEAQLLYQVWKLGEFSGTTPFAAPSEADIRIFPNPFNSSARIMLSLPLHIQRAELRVHNLLGQEVMSRQIGAGSGRAEFVLDGAGLATGVYLVSARAGGMVAARKVMVLK